MGTSYIILIISSVLIWFILLPTLLINLGIIKNINSGKGKMGEGWLMVGSLAPSFEVSDIHGSIVTLDSYNGKSVLFVFIRPSCRSCETLIPKLLKINEDIKTYDQEIIIVCVADMEAAKIFADQYSISLPILIAPRHENLFAKKYKIGATPFYCLIDQDQKVKEVGYFAPEWNLQEKKWTYNAFDNKTLVVKNSVN